MTLPAASFHDNSLLFQRHIGNQAIQAWSKPEAAKKISVSSQTDSWLIQRSPYKAQILSLEEIARDAYKERLRKQSGQIVAKACRSINQALTPDNCPTVLREGKVVTVLEEKVSGLWLQIDCSGLPGFGPKEQCHVLGAFARRVVPPKTGKTPPPEEPEKTPPVSEPTPEVPAVPEVLVPDREGCSDKMSRQISEAISCGVSDLFSTIDALRERPLTPLTRDAMWLSLRTTSEEAAEGIAEKLESVTKELNDAKIACDEPGIVFCATEHDRGYVNPLTGTIHICKANWETANDLVRERAVIHEGLHAFARLSGIDEKYHEDDCTEGDVVGLGRFFRLQNADSLACMVMLLTHSAETDLEAQVRHSKGEELAIKQTPVGDISLDADPQSTQFKLVGYKEVGLSKIRWIFKDEKGRRYLLRNIYSNEIISPDIETDYVRGIYIGAKTRELLKQRNVKDMELIVKCEISEVGEKVNRIHVHLIP